jgi:hypothetical protein
MRFSILPAVALLTTASSALAQMPPQRHYDSRMDNGDQAIHPADDAAAVDGPGNGLQLELNVFREAGSYSTDNVLSVAGTAGGTGSTVGGFISTLQPLALIGYQWDQNALLLGIGVAAIGGTAGSGTTIFFGVTPTYRRYMSPLRTGKLSTFAEVGVTISLVSFPGEGGTDGAGGSGGTTSWGVGAEVSGGAEWLFVKNFGLFGKAGITYGHLNLSSGPSGPSTNLDAVGLEGDVGLAVHL